MSSNTPIAVRTRPLIMVVDDEVDITETYAMLLELHGYSVVCAHNGADALAKLEDGMPDLIVSDCMMPVMNGTDFCAALRQLPGGDQVPVILCSGAPDQHDLAGDSYDVFLLKPVFFDRLLEELTRLLPSP